VCWFYRYGPEPGITLFSAELHRKKLNEAYTSIGHLEEGLYPYWTHYFLSQRRRERRVVLMAFTHQ